MGKLFALEERMNLIFIDVLIFYIGFFKYELYILKMKNIVLMKI